MAVTRQSVDYRYGNGEQASEGTNKKGHTKTLHFHKTHQSSKRNIHTNFYHTLHSSYLKCFSHNYQNKYHVKFEKLNAIPRRTTLRHRLLRSNEPSIDYFYPDTEKSVSFPETKYALGTYSVIDYQQIVFEFTDLVVFGFVYNDWVGGRHCMMHTNNYTGKKSPSTM